MNVRRFTSQETFLLKFCKISTILLFFPKLLGLFLPHWFYQGRDKKLWKGNLFGVYSSGGLINLDTYSSLSNYFDSEKYKFPSDYSKTSLSYNEAEILSAQFSNLSSGLLGYLSLSIISLSCFLALFIFFLTCKKFPWPFCCSGIFYVTQVCSEVSCIIAMTASSRITLYGNCHYLSIIDDSLEIMNVCGDNASVYGLIISLVIIVNDIFLLVCFCYRKNTPVNVGSLETQEESEHIREFGIRIRKKDEVEVEDIEQPE